jgi:predicted small secreted protein
MKTLQILIVFIAAATLSSCNFDISMGQIDGNGNVVTEERPVSDFTKVKGSAGIDVFLTEGTENKVVVEADENLMEFIETTVEGGKLRIRSSRNNNIGRAKAKKVHVTYVSLTSIEASSGADVIGNSVIKSETLNLDSSSGADLELEILSKEVFAETSSGSDMKLSGKATTLRAKASSGSDLDAKELLVANCNADASSGADIKVNVKERLSAEASSGGDVHYYGDPAAVTNNSGRTGSVHKM